MNNFARKFGVTFVAVGLTVCAASKSFAQDAPSSAPVVDQVHTQKLLECVKNAMTEVAGVPVVISKTPLDGYILETAKAGIKATIENGGLIMQVGDENKPRDTSILKIKDTKTSMTNFILSNGYSDETVDTLHRTYDKVYVCMGGQLTVG